MAPSTSGDEVSVGAGFALLAAGIGVCCLSGGEVIVGPIGGKLELNKAVDEGGGSLGCCDHAPIFIHGMVFACDKW